MVCRPDSKMHRQSPSEDGFRQNRKAKQHLLPSSETFPLILSPESGSQPRQDFAFIKLPVPGPESQIRAWPPPGCGVHILRGLRREDNEPCGMVAGRGVMNGLKSLRRSALFIIQSEWLVDCQRKII